MNFGWLLESAFPKRMSFFVAVTFMVAAMVLAVASPSSSQLPYRPPFWSVQSTTPAQDSLTLRGSLMTGVDTGIFYVVQFRVQGNGVNQLGSFQPGMSVILESSPAKLPSLAAPGTTTSGKAQPQSASVGKSITAATVFTSIPTVGQTLWIQASGISPVEAVVANVTGPQTYTAGQPGPPCCTVTAVNYQTTFQAVVASAKVNSSGQTFEFALPQPPAGTPPCDPVAGGPSCPSPVSVKVGQMVWANLTTGQVSLDGKTPCCQITAEGTSLSGPGGKPTTGGNKPVVKAPACCVITALNQQAKSASAKVNNNGQAFQIAITNPALFQSLHIGQVIWANFQTHQVSVNGLVPVDGMQIMGSAMAMAGGPSIVHGPGITIAGKKPPYNAIPSPSSPPLTIHDHTLIMQAVIRNHPYLVQRIKRQNGQQATQQQIASRAMVYLLQWKTVPDATKERVRVALQAMRKPLSKPTTADVSFLNEVGIAIHAAKDSASIINALSTLEQKYAGQQNYANALNLSKELVNDGSPTIYSPTWLAKNLQRPSILQRPSQGPSSGGGITNYDLPLPQCDPTDPDCVPGGSGCNPADPTCGGCDPATDPTCGCDPATDPNCTTGTCVNPFDTFPNCTTPVGQCPNPAATYPNCNAPPPPTCPDGSNPPCTQPPTTCPDGSTPPCLVTPPCPDPNNPVCNPGTPINLNAFGPDVKGCAVGAVLGAIGGALGIVTEAPGALVGCAGGALEESIRAVVDELWQQIFGGP